MINDLDRNLRKRNYVLIDWFILVDQTLWYTTFFLLLAAKHPINALTAASS